MMLSGASIAVLLVGVALSGCDEVKPNQPVETARIRAEAKRHKDACASNAAYDRLKRVIFSQAGRQFNGDRSNLATLEEFSFVRMEDPVVVSWDPALDLTRCRGLFILDAPPGSEKALGGERRLQANITYTAQGAADASGLVYEIQGAEPIVGMLAAFNLPGASYRPLPAVDIGPAPAEPGDLESGARTVIAGREAPLPPDQPRTAPTRRARVPRPTSPRLASTEPEVREPAGATPASDAPSGVSAEHTVRAFYDALASGNGELASAQVIPAKRSSRAYSPDAISRFYGRLSEPLILTGVSALSRDSYRVRYRYAAPRSRCNGSAVVRLTSAGGRPLIRSITAENGC